MTVRGKIKIKKIKTVDPTEYSFCESTTASSLSNWHIRKLDAKGLCLSGGITTSSLCGHVNPRIGGWDLDVPINEFHLEHACCQSCVDAFKKETGV
jgi:hypothetical protein